MLRLVAATFALLLFVGVVSLEPADPDKRCSLDRDTGEMVCEPVRRLPLPPLV